MKRFFDSATAEFIPGSDPGIRMTKKVGFIAGLKVMRVDKDRKDSFAIHVII